MLKCIVPHFQCSKPASATPASMADITAQLQAIADKPDQKQKLELYKQLLQTLLQSPAVETCNAFVDHSACRNLARGRRDARHRSPHLICLCTWPRFGFLSRLMHPGPSLHLQHIVSPNHAATAASAHASCSRHTPALSAAMRAPPTTPHPHRAARLLAQCCRMTSSW